MRLSSKQRCGGPHKQLLLCEEGQQERPYVHSAQAALTQNKRKLI